MGLKLFHATQADNLDGIRVSGLRGPSYWSLRDDIHSYYVETIEDEDQTPVTLIVDIDDLLPHLIEPDMPGIEEPIATILGRPEEDIRSEWDRSDRSWRACLDLIGTLRYGGDIPPGAISIGDLNGDFEYEPRPLVPGGQ